MSRPKLFIGSSKKNLRVATVLAEGLEEGAEVTVWNEGIFGLNQSFLETLLKTLEEFDFAAFVLAPDDITLGSDQTRPSPRDNVLFESGLFMGVLGRERVFLVCDASVPLKIPSDLAGVTLASYEGARIDGNDAAAAVRKAVRTIGDRISASRFPHLLGEWRSRYPMTIEDEAPMVDEVLEVRPAKDGVSLTTKTSSHGDYYTSFGRLASDRQIIGRWKSRPGLNDLEGLFILTVSPGADFMFGYFTCLDSNGSIAYATWILAKQDGADESKIERRLGKAQDMLATRTFGTFPPQRPSPLANYDRYSRALDNVKMAGIRSARSEIWLVGATMHHTLTNSQALLSERVAAGVSLNVLVADPTGRDFEATARSFGQSKTDLEAESMLTLRACRQIAQRLANQNNVQGTFDVRLLDTIFTAGAYFFDPEREDGRMILVPHLPGRDAAEVPGQVWQWTPDGPVTDYLSIYRQLRESPAAVRFATWMEVNSAALG